VKRTVWLLLATAACAGAVQAPAPGPLVASGPASGPALGTGSAPSASASPASSASARTLRWTSAPPTASSAQIELKFPIQEQLIPRAKLDRYLVRFELREAARDPAIAWVLDDAPAVVTRGAAREQRLAELTEAPLADGPHWLVAALVDAGGALLARPEARGRAAFAAVHFYVGVRPPLHDDLDAPRLVWFSPRPTLHGAAAAQVDFVLLHPERLPASTTLRLRARACGAGAVGDFALDGLAVGAGRLGDLPSGDWELELAPSRGDGQPRTRAAARGATPVNAPFLFGVYSGWALMQVLLGAFFALAYALARRATEYRLFALICATLAVGTFGMAMVYGASEAEGWERGSVVTHVGVILAVALNSDFVLRFVGAAWRRNGALAGYALAALFLMHLLFGSWWSSPPVVSPISVFGWTVHHVTQQPSALAILFYVVASAQQIATVGVLGAAVRGGRRDALPALIGAVIVTSTAVHDSLIVPGIVRSVFLLPHGFMAYALGVAATLVFRYQGTSEALERTAASLEQRTRELDLSYDALRHVQDELVEQQRLAAVGELAAAIAHEVRNPLAIIVNATAGLRRPTLRPDDRDTLLGIVDEEAQRLNRLVTDLLRFARPVALERSRVALPELVSATSERILEGRHLTASTVGEALSVSGDPNQLRHALDALIENACQASTVDGVVRVHMEETEIDGRPAVRVDVEDEGSGMDKTVLDRARKPFFTTRPSGTGLGLPIVERIVTAHGGRFELDSVPHQGTRATLTLPVDPPPRLSQHSVRLERAG
jgi:signal transduction histidine kinase